MTKTETLKRELVILKKNYGQTLDVLQQRLNETREKLDARDRVSDHDPFNMSATCQELAKIAGKIEATEAILRWAETVEAVPAAAGKVQL